MCKCTAYLPSAGSPFFAFYHSASCTSTCMYFMSLREHIVISQSAVGGKEFSNSSADNIQTRPFIWGSPDHHNIHKPHLKYKHTCRLLIVFLYHSVASAPLLLPDFPAKWQLVSPWTGSWYQPEREARLINLIDLQWLENKLSEQLCLSDHISLPKS